MMKRIIKIFLLALCLLLALSLAACDFPGDGGTGDDGHVHRVLHWEIVYDVDCENDGRRVGICVDCENEVRDEQLSLAHDYRAGVCVRCGSAAPGSEPESKPMFEYELTSDGSGYILSAVNGFEGKELTIASEFEGKPVVKIGDDAFHGLRMLESVTIPDSVTSIGARAFAYCERLRSVSMGENVKSLGYSAFTGCTGLYEIELPKATAKVDDNCFYGCVGLARVSAEGLREIGASAFWGCESLSAFEFADGIAYIGDYAFYGSGITSVEINGRVDYIGSGAFSRSAVTFVKLTGEVSNMGYNVFAECTMLETAVIGKAELKDEFAFCPLLKNLCFENSERIDANAVAVCPALETVRLQGELVYMGEIFSGSEGLRRIVYDGTSSEWLALKRNLYWHFVGEGCVIECSDRVLTRGDLIELEKLA